MREPAPANTDVLFKERHGPSPTFTVIGVLCVGVVLVRTVYDIHQYGGAVKSILIALGALTFMGLFYAFLAWMPGTTECKSIRVDGSGLRVGRERLPAQEVGQCLLVPEDEASATALSGHYGNIKIGSKVGSYGFFASSGPAVFVLQERAGLKRPGWFIAARDPEGLLAALTQLRIRAGRAT